jgi:hypothetical protein
MVAWSRPDGTTVLLAQQGPRCYTWVGQFQPVGLFDSSPAIHRWEGGIEFHLRPVGTFEALVAHFDGPYGTCRQKMATNPLPSDKSLGYCHTSLRDKNAGKDKQ